MTPNFNDILVTVNRSALPSKLPLYEHFADDEIVEKIMGYDFKAIQLRGRERELKIWSQRFEFYRQMGYDYVPFEIGPRFAPRQNLLTDDTSELNRGQRGWVNEQGGVISTWEDLENPAYWPEGMDAFDYEGFDALCELVPAGMKIIGGASGGPFEHASFLVGLQKLSMLMYDDPPFVERLFNRIGEMITAIARELVKREALGIYRFGDDLGYRTATMLSTSQLRKYVFPWQKKVVEEAHKGGKPFLLHSCGNLAVIMDDLIDDVGIDAKHSWEDVIMPVTEAKKRWGSRIAILGGVDVDYMCQHSAEEVYDYTMRIIEECAPGGGYAAGTGNTVTNYIPVENYLAMLRAVNTYNGTK